MVVILELCDISINRFITSAQSILSQIELVECDLLCTMLHVIVDGLQLDDDLVEVLLVEQVSL